MARPQPKPEPSLYETDFYAWTQEQGAKLRARAHNDIDWENVAEEIESVGRSDKKELRKRLEVLIRHLLKWEHQVSKRKSGWRSTIFEQRRQIISVIDDSPSLQGFPEAELGWCYDLARMKAAGETGLRERMFPEQCPFSVDQILDEAFFPGVPWSKDDDLSIEL